MRNLRHVIVAVVLVLIAAISTSASVPEKAWGKAAIGQGAPMWVSEELAVVDDQLQRHHFHPDILTLLEQSIEGSRPANAQRCSIYTETAGPDGVFKGSTAASIRANSAQLVSGVISDLKQGFLYGQAGTMLEVAADAGTFDLGDQQLYVFLTLADIQVEGTHLCTGRGEGRASPNVGASIVLALDRELDEERVLGRTLEGGVIVQPQANEVLISGALPRAYEFLKVGVDELRRQLRKDGGWR